MILTNEVALKNSPLASFTTSGKNTLADAYFYDVSNLRNSEYKRLVAKTTKEGKILIVEPMDSSVTPSIRPYCNEKLDNGEIRSATTNMVTKGSQYPYVKHFVMAGVGSSDVGAASLARTLANALGKPVGAIVAGLGVTDLVYEALGGWFFYGKRNRYRAFIDQYIKLLTEVNRVDTLEHQKLESLPISDPFSDIKSLITLIKDEHRNVSMLLGHSKGCLQIAEVLSILEKQQTPQNDALMGAIEVITTGAVVKLPEQKLKAVHQYLGQFDALGYINSTLNQNYIKVKNAQHHLNTKIPMAMNLTDILRDHM